MNPDLGFAEVTWNDNGLKSESWKSSATTNSEDVYRWARDSMRTVHVQGEALTRTLHGIESFDALRVVSSSTFLAKHELDSAISSYQNARDLLYHWEHNQKGRIASVYAVFYVERNFSDMNLEAINSLLLCASPRRLTEWSMVALLRASYSAKHMLPGWNKFLEAVKEELKGNDRADRLLSGLDD